MTDPKAKPMNINNLYEAVPVGKGLPERLTASTSEWYDVYCDDEQFRKGWYHFGKEIWELGNDEVIPIYWLRPVTRESIEAFLRELIDLAWTRSQAHCKNPLYPDKQTAITELINKTLGQFTNPAPLGDKQKQKQVK